MADQISASEESRFKTWKQAVNAACHKLCGLTTDDLPDVDFWAWFEEGVSPTTAARRTIKYAREN